MGSGCCSASDVRLPNLRACVCRWSERGRKLTWSTPSGRALSQMENNMACGLGGGCELRRGTAESAGRTVRVEGSGEAAMTRQERNGLVVGETSIAGPTQASRVGFDVAGTGGALGKDGCDSGPLAQRGPEATAIFGPLGYGPGAAHV